MDEYTIKIKKFKYFKRIFKKYSQFIFNLFIVVLLVFLFWQNYYQQKALQCTKTNDLNLFNEVNKLRVENSNLRADIEILDSIITIQSKKFEKLKQKNK